MWLRRAFFSALWVASIVLPLWVFLGRAFFGAPLGYQFLAQIVLVPLLFVGQAAAGGIVFLRSSVRRSRAVSGLDAVLLALAWVGQLGIGFFLVDSGARASTASAFTALAGSSSLAVSTALSAASIVLTVAAVGGLIVAGVWQAVQEARAGVQRALAGLDPARRSATFREPSFASDPERTIRITPRA
ncbi:hypothetical protein AS850_09460 [Frondihabitans sp. 762G35]|uniref:hypothetical protein n=1 Tax=Frondihabitans sp. 762G35 TaxID=1446794 RepID=UPI000D22B77F|nr:hypothetical protein [Frondihabitans sp. 762G35]ARC57302.1 hypothetical protein AS850_09460 [Frondihabitans sp. 762G35]